jgi:hypothetical protein
MEDKDEETETVVLPEAAQAALAEMPPHLRLKALKAAFRAAQLSVLDEYKKQLAADFVENEKARLARVLKDAGLDGFLSAVCVDVDGLPWSRESVEVFVCAQTTVFYDPPSVDLDFENFGSFDSRAWDLSKASMSILALTGEDLDGDVTTNCYSYNSEHAGTSYMEYLQGSVKIWQYTFCEERERERERGREHLDE